MCSELVGCPTAQHLQFLGVSVGFLQERQVEPCIGFGGVSHVSLDTPRCVSCSSRKHRQVSCHCVVFSGWRVMYVCGVGAVSLRSCFSAAGDSCVPLPLLTGLSRSVGCAFLQNCTYRGTLGALGPWTAPRISHSPSSCRACNLRLHGHTGHCGVPQQAHWQR